MIVRRFEEITVRYGDRIAIDMDEEMVSYGELNRMANRLGRALLASYPGGDNDGQQPRVVGLLLSRGIGQVVGILGALKARMIYVPLDRTYPRERLLQMLHNSGVGLVIASHQDREYAQSLCAGVEERAIGLLDIKEMHHSGYPGENIDFETPGPGDQLAYIIYTSGSTGVPKGVAQECGNVCFFADHYIGSLSVTPADRLSYVSSFSHDGAVNDIFTSLLAGAVLCPFEIRGDLGISGIGYWLARKQVNFYHSVVSVFRYAAAAMKESGVVPRLRLIVLGGEQLLLKDILIAREMFPGVEFAHMYGQSESSVNTMGFYDTSKPVERITIGAPLDGIRLLVLNEEGEEVEPYEIGEIFIACAHLAPGYWHNPEATAKAFFADEELGRIYRSGDLGKVGIDGEIEFVGRKDHQVKIRGFRVELTEIEQWLIQHEKVREAVVTARQSSLGDTFLCAYIVPEVKEGEGAPSALQLATYLGTLLPEYMVPAHYHLLEKMPQTSTGKIDRRSLPEPDIGGQDYTAPRDEVEEILENIWSELLGLEKQHIGIDADFFFIGGHSLRATTLIARMQKRLDVRVPLQKVFECRTIRELAMFIREAGKTTYEAVEPVEEKEYYELTPAQQRFYFMQQMAPQGVAFNMSRPIPLGENVDTGRLEKVFQMLIERHESLRTSFIIVDHQPVQRIHVSVKFHLETCDGSGKSLSGLLGEFVQPFDLSQSPLLRARLVLVGDGQRILLVDMHHIISDGTSQLVLTQDFLSLYVGEELPALKLRYRDFATWLNGKLLSEEMKVHEEYWLKRMRGILPTLNLPTDFPRPFRRRVDGAHFHASLGTRLSEQVNRLARENGATLYMVLLAAFNVLLSRYSGQYDILVGSPVAGRYHADLERVIGLVIGGMVLRHYPHPRKTFKKFLEELKAETLAAYEHQSYPLEELMRKIDWQERPGHDHMIDVALIVQNMFDDPMNLQVSGDSRGREVRPPVKGEHTPATSKLDISIYVVEQGGDTWLRIEYCTVLFKPGTIERMNEHLAAILRQVVRDPEIFLAHIDLVGEEEKERVAGSGAQFYPLTHAQKRILYTERTFPGTSCNTAVFSLRFDEILDHGLLEQSVNHVIGKHDAMRLRMVEFPFQGEPLQYLVPQVHYKLEIHDEEWIKTDSRVPIGLFDFSLYTFAYINFTGGGTGLYLKLHHIITDGMSIYLLAQEITGVYQLLCKNQPVDETRRPSYFDYLSYETQYVKAPQAERDREFWHKKLLPLPERVELWKPGRVATERAIKNPESEAVLLAFPGDVREQVHVFRQENRTSVFKLMLSAFAIYISRVTGSMDVVIAGTNHNRNNEEQRRMAGMFVSTFPIRMVVEGQMRFGDFISRNSQDLDFLLKNHQRYPFDRLLEELREMTGQDAVYLLDVCLIGLPDIMGSPFHLQRYTVGVDTTPLTVHINRNNRDIEGVLEMMWQYHVDLFTREEIEQMHRSLTAILRFALAHPETELSDIDLVGVEEKEALLYTFNRTGGEKRYPEPHLVQQLFEQSVERNRDHIALIASSKVKTRKGKEMERVSLTYGELNQWVNQMAHGLMREGVMADTIVAVFSEASLEMIVSLLAILKAGGIYLPISPGNPGKRTAYILTDSQPLLVLMQEDLALAIPRGFQGKILGFDWVQRVSGDDLNPGCRNQSGDGAYIIYTSGSTGHPKGVWVEHGNLLAYLNAFANEFNIGSRDIVIQQASYAFDAFVEECYPVLLNGGKLAVPGYSVIKDIQALVRYIQEQNITMITCSPLLLNEINRQGGSHRIRVFISGGDRLKRDYIDGLVERGPVGTVVYNTYGPTESTVCITYHRCQPGDPVNVPIGKPILDYRVYILDRYRQLLPVGVGGELCVAGPGIVRGYMNRPELTGEKFVFLEGWNHAKVGKAGREQEESVLPVNVGAGPVGMIYKTGDLACWLSDGSIEFLGRIDRQVKVRGYRIELEEIENRLRQAPGVKDVAVLDVENGTNLCAYIVPLMAGSEMDVQGLRDLLSLGLPEYMVPGYFQFIDHIPYTISGKVDRRGLPALEIVGGKVKTAPRDSVEQRLSWLWAKVLGIAADGIDIDADFFQLGGHSLKAMLLISNIQKEFHVPVTMAELFKMPYIREIARHIREAEKVEFVEMEKADQRDYYPLSYNQQRLYVLQQMNPQSAAYHIPLRFVLDEAIDGTVVMAVFKRLVERHEMLRTTIHVKDHEPVQRVADARDVTIPLMVADISGLEGLEKARKREEIYAQVALERFNLEELPLFRVAWVKLEPGVSELMFNMHHIVSDGWSIQVLRRDFLMLVMGLRQGQEVKLTPLPFQYVDYACWHNRLLDPVAGADHPGLRFWLEKLKNGIPPVQLPVDYTEGIDTAAGAEYHCMINQELKVDIEGLLEKHHCTLFSLLFSVYLVLLSRVSSQEEIGCSIIAAGREHGSFQSIVGLFVNSILFRARVNADEPFALFLDRVHEDVLATLQYQGYPMELIFEQLSMRFPQVPVSFNVLNMQDISSGQRIDFFEPFHREVVKDIKFDLEPYITEYENGIAMRWVYRKNLFETSTIEFIVQQYIKLLEFFTHHPGQTLNEQIKQDIKSGTIAFKKTSTEESPSPRRTFKKKQ